MPGGGSQDNPASATILSDDFSASKASRVLEDSASLDAARQCVVLTPDQAGMMGRLLYSTKATMDNWTATFKIKIDGTIGGGDGLTFACMQNADYQAAGGDQLAFGGNGFGVEFDTYPSTGTSDPSGQHIAVIAGSTSHHLKTYLPPDSLWSSDWRPVRVRMENGTLSVWYDGAIAVSSYTLPSYTAFTGVFGFSAATSVAHELHAVSDVKIVDNQAAQTVEGPVLSSAVMDAAGETLTLTYDVPLAGNSVDTGSFALGGTTARIMSGAVSGSHVSLTLASPITSDQANVSVACAQGCVTGVSGAKSPEVGSLAVMNNSTIPGPLKIAGFDFLLNVGDFWQYGWQTSISVHSQKTASSTGTCAMTLGRPATIQGITAYSLLLSGVFPPGHTPGWKYIAIDRSRLLGSDDGTTLKDIFNARTGTNTGGGFFCRFADTDVTSAIATSMSTSFYSNPSVYTLGVSDPIEYFAPGVGPVGYTRTYSPADEAGSTFTESMGVTSSSTHKGALQAILHK